jgi:hypothetical protein
MGGTSDDGGTTFPAPVGTHGTDPADAPRRRTGAGRRRPHEPARAGRPRRTATVVSLTGKLAWGELGRWCAATLTGHDVRLSVAEVKVAGRRRRQTVPRRRTRGRLPCPSCATGRGDVRSPSRPVASTATQGGVTCTLKSSSCRAWRTSSARSGGMACTLRSSSCRAWRTSSARSGGMTCTLRSSPCRAWRTSSARSSGDDVRTQVQSLPRMAHLLSLIGEASDGSGLGPRARRGSRGGPARSRPAADRCRPTTVGSTVRTHRCTGQEVAVRLAMDLESWQRC